MGRPSGTGLGLYISKTVAKKMGGDLWLESSKPGKGSVFTFSLPRFNPKTSGKILKKAVKEKRLHFDQKELS